jgi:RNA polymerase sigma factor (sigma-70 family)
VGPEDALKQSHDSDRHRVGASFPEVLTAAQLGADWAWAVLYRSVATRVLGYARAHGAPDPEAVVGDVFLSLARGIGAFDGDESGFRSWVFVIAHRRVIDERRRRGSRPQFDTREMHELAGSVAGGDVEQEALNRLGEFEALALLDGLSALQRDVLLLRFLADMSIEDVARTLGRPVTAIKAVQRRAIATLRRRVQAMGYPGDARAR